MARMQRRRSRPEEDLLDGVLMPSTIDRLHKGEFGHISEAAVAEDKLLLAEELCRQMRPWARARVLGRATV